MAAGCSVSGLNLPLKLLICCCLVTTATMTTEEAVFQIITPASHKLYKYIWLTTDNQQLRLRITGKQGAHIALAKSPRDITQAYEVIIGRSDPPRQNIDILDMINARAPVAAIQLSNIINVNTGSDFWITWSGGVIRVGEGSVIGQTERVHWRPSGGLHPVTAVSMDTYTNSNITWQFLRDSARDLWLWSRGSDIHNIWFLRPIRHYFTFGARGCAEAKVGLSGRGHEDSAGNHTSLVILGVNTNRSISVIMDQIEGGNVVASANTPNIISCTQTRYFWVSWDRGHIQVGKGLKVGENMLLSGLPPIPHNVSRVTPFFGTGAGTDAEFHFRNVEENYYLLKSKSQYNMDTTHTINVQQTTSFVFRVRACYNAVLILKRLPENHTSSLPHYTIVTLGRSTFQGKKSNVAFKWDDGTGDGQDIDSPDILSCHVSRHLWLGWRDDYIRVGRGDEPYLNQIFQVQNHFLPFNVESLHLASLTAEYEVEWQLSRSQAPSIAMTVLPSLGTSQAWLTVAESTHLYFKVRGQDSVRLLLTSYVGNSEVSVYTTRISNLALHQHTSAIWRNADQAVAVSRVTRSILSEVTLRPFWVSWAGDKVQFGRGMEVGQDVVLTLSDSGLLEINAISFAAGTNAVSTWEVVAEDVRRTTVPSSAATTDKTTTATPSQMKVPKPTKNATGKGFFTTSSPTNTNPDPGSEGNPNLIRVVYIVVGIFLPLVLIAVVVLLLVVRYKPESMPHRILEAVPTSLQRKISRHPDSVPVSFTKFN